MELQYQKVFLSLNFEAPIKFTASPLFVLRGVLGWQLRTMCCIATSVKCPTCLYNKTCAYAYIFETILSKDNDIQKGRDRASHPFVLTQDKATALNQFVSNIQFNIILLGKAVDFLPYIYAAFIRAGKSGLLRERIPFVLADMQIQGESVIVGDDSLKTDIAPLVWKSNASNPVQQDSACNNGKVLVQLLSPLRFKTNGRYTADFDAKAFMACLYRRMGTLCTLYGCAENNVEYNPYETKLKITDRKLAWADTNHYSARQKTEISLGGVIGTFELEGAFSCSELDVLDFAKCFSAGKNTNFGLGQMDYWTKLDV